MSKKSITLLKEEFDKAQSAGRSCLFIIDSQGGEFCEELLLLLDVVQNARYPTAAKIINAASAAAMLALSVQYREMQKDGIIALHNAVMSVGSIHLAEDGKVHPWLFEFLKKSDAVNVKLLGRCRPGLKADRRDSFFARGELTIQAEECLTAGLVQQII